MEIDNNVQEIESLNQTEEFQTETNADEDKLLLSDRMKQYETEFNYKILPTEAFVIRLDGRSFSKFTKKLFKPFDMNFVKAMSLTMRDLVKKFEAQTGYTHSDEITLVFNSKCTDEDYQLVLSGQIEPTQINYHTFDGRVQKLLTLTSSYCSVRFNYHLEKTICNEVSTGNFKYDESFVDLVKAHEQMFDARILKFSNDKIHEILNHQIWRSIHDCERNAIQTFAYTNIGSKKILNKNCTQMTQMLSEIGINWNNIPTFLKHGIYCKKILIEKEIGENKVFRGEYVFKQFKINFSQDNLNMLLNKYWDNLNNSFDPILLNERDYITLNA